MSGIGVEAIQHIDVLRAKLLEYEARIDSLEKSVAWFASNMTVNIASSGFAVVKQPNEPPHPSSGDLLWIKQVSGSGTTFYLSSAKSTGARTWEWLTESE